MTSETPTATSAVVRLLTQRETAELLGVTERTVYALRRAGRLRAVIVGPGAIRFDPADVRAFVEAAKDGNRT